MDSTATRRVVDAASCLAALAALWVLARFLPGVNSFEADIVAVGAAIALLALVDGDRSPVILGVPALMLVLLLVPGERQRLLAFGIVLAASLSVAAIRWVDSGRVASSHGVVLLAAALGPALLLPVGGDGLLAATLAGLGAIAIVLAASESRRVGVDVVMIAFCAAIVAPAVPVRSALFPFVAATMIVTLRKPGPFTAGAFVLSVLAAGKWYLPLLLATGFGFAFGRLQSTGRTSGSGAVTLPFLSGIPASSIAALAVSPDAWWRARHVGIAASTAATAFAAGSLFVQPSLATIYGLSALACLLAVGACERWSVTLSAFVLIMSGLTAWSGALAGSFPLPVPLVVVVLLAAGVWASAGGGGESGSLLAARSALAAGLAAMIVLLHPVLDPPRDAIAADLRLVAGERVSIPLPPGVDVVRVEVSGGNVAGLGGGEMIGRVTVEPVGESSDLRIGDIADWGARRREHFLGAKNRQPLEPAGPIFGRGREAFLSGAGIVRVDASGGRTLTIEALPTIGERGRLLIAAVEVQRR